ncbi:hypothetical protein LOAG_18195 [Loa loa]|uniref:Uncharacterized protein n=1 Tax=Loa loa TaxID=7209 RepID=A0A1S0UFY7_LOALO|nr:hypothetical protein LOAG_18195 [Loa loa]EJD74495.1 hypothetical protein LOAG_18195 [Loa loa]
MIPTILTYKTRTLSSNICNNFIQNISSMYDGEPTSTDMAALVMHIVSLNVNTWLWIG